jgi:Tol biopolymer transport system component
MAFVSMESGRPEVYVQAFDAMRSPQLVDEKRQVSREGAWIVRWRPDGREIFYVGIDNWLHAASVGANSQVGDPKPLFRIEGNTQYGTTSDFQFDATRDGQRFIMTTIGSVAPPAFTVIQNWQEKFRR